MLVKAFEQAGFRLVRSNNHLIWQCPCGHARVPSPTSVGRGRSAQNMKAEIARTLRACKALEGKAA